MKKIIFLHHSTGESIWVGKTNHYVYRLTGRADVGLYFKRYNRKNKTKYYITQRNFPSLSPYGWKNYPYDYYNIWVKNAGDKPYLNEPTLEILTQTFDIIIFKHCFPVSMIKEDIGRPDIDSDEKRLENYKVQYEALKRKMHEFPNTRFIVWTPPVMVKGRITEDQAGRTREFYRWIMDEWIREGDNIFIWDFYNYQTEGGLYLKDEYSKGGGDSHPSKDFAGRLATLFARFVIGVAEGSVSE